MSVAQSPNLDAIPLSQRGPASRDIVVRFGFWLFLLSDIVVFAALFAAYAVLSRETAGGPSGTELFSRSHTFIETTCLLLSSFACGLMTIGGERRQVWIIYVAAFLTFALGTTFIGLELWEFADLLAQGAGPSRSAFLSAFFGLVGAHGLHVAVGLGALLLMVLQVATLGLRPIVIRRRFCFGLFWHALDIVWVGVFTIVYLGAH